MAIKVKPVRKNQGVKNTRDKWYADVEHTSMLGVVDLAEAIHTYCRLIDSSTAELVVRTMARVLRQLVLDGYSVKIDHLAIFKAGIESEGVAELGDFNLQRVVKRIKLVTKATGDFSASQLSNDAHVEISKIGRQMILGLSQDGAAAPDDQE